VRLHTIEQVPDVEPRDRRGRRGGRSDRGLVGGLYLGDAPTGLRSSAIP